MACVGYVTGVFSVSLLQKSIQSRCFSCTSLTYAKYKKNQFRLRKHNNRVGDRSNELATLPDWSFADGRPAPPGLHKNRNMEIQKQICRRIIIFLDEMKTAEQDEKENSKHVL